MFEELIDAAGRSRGAAAIGAWARIENAAVAQRLSAMADLESVTGGTTYRDAMADYADHQWRTEREPATGLFNAGDEHTELLEQAAMVQLCAVLAADPRCWTWLY